MSVLRMRYFHDNNFANQIRKMRRDGGQSKNAAESVQALLYRIQEGEEKPFRGLKTTNKGETRIKKCVKYDLSGFTRLVTIVYQDQTVLLFAGTHSEVDKWLDRNAGTEFIVNSELEIVKTGKPTTQNAKTSIDTKFVGPLFARLEKKWQTELSGSRTFSEMADILNLQAGASNSEIAYAVEAISDLDLRKTMEDVLVLVNAGEIEAAQNRIDLSRGVSTPLDDLPDADLVRLKTGEGIIEVKIGSSEYQKWLQNFLEAEHAFEWFLFMHPEQQAFVDQDYSGPAKLSGVSGSGKTAVAIKRAIRLAEKYSDCEILLVTINKSLSHLLSEIVDFACNEAAIREKVVVKSFSEVAIDLLKEFDPNADRHFRFESLGLEDHKDEVYREFYRCLLNNRDAEVLLPVHRSLVSQRIDAERYIYEEFDWIRSVFSQKERKNYLSVERKGRAYPLLPSFRKNLLDGLKKWEDKMTNVGVIDPLGLTMALLEHLQKIKPKYRSIIIDEAQDFGTTELKILNRLVDTNENDLFFCGDGAQQVQAKQQDFAAADISISKRSFKLQKNYRNSREILELAHQILVQNLSEEHMDLSELEISDPQFATRSSHKPLLLKAESLEAELSVALQLMRDNEELYKERNSVHTGCIALAGFTLFEIEEFGKKLGMRVLNGQSQARFGPSASRSSFFLSDLEQTKGYEFETMIILNCEEGILPPSEMPKEEMYRFVSQFYVAMTRAKHQLVFSYSDKLSAWLQDPSLNLKPEPWFDFVDEKSCTKSGIPGKLAEFPGVEVQDILSITGFQFVYTGMARGLEPNLLAKIPELIDGRGLKRSGKQIKWKTVSEAISDLKGVGGKGRYEIFGPKSDADILENVSKELSSSKAVLDRSIQNFDAIKVKPTVQVKSRYSQPSDLVGKPTQDIGIKVGDEVGEDIAPRNDNIDQLGLPQKIHLVCHSLRKLYVRDLESFKNSTFEKHLTRPEIKLLRKKVKEHLRKNNSGDGKKDIDTQVVSHLLDAPIDARLRAIINDLGIKYVADLNKLDERTLKSNPRIGLGETRQLRNLARQYGIRIKKN